MWYTRQNKQTQLKLKRLIQNGQFEVTGGGWSSNDEATPNYSDLINNMMVGH
jgi:lysosomal alpha-mannosidase